MRNVYAALAQAAGVVAWVAGWWAIWPPLGACWAGLILVVAGERWSNNDEQ